MISAEKHTEDLMFGLIDSILYYIKYDKSFETIEDSPHIRAGRVQAVMANGRGKYKVIMECGDIVSDFFYDEQRAIDLLIEIQKDRLRDSIDIAND